MKSRPVLHRKHIGQPVQGFGLKIRHKLRQALVGYLCLYMSVMPVFAAGITPDNTGGGNTNLGTPSGANNIPVLNINAPTNGGVSHNKYQDFNVEEKGLIVNNLNMASYNPNYTSSLSGEHVEFNRNFGTGNAAKVILNEVVSNSTSSLRGQTEIYGHRADYIVANPNGITCAGCGFINIGRLSMITGTANMSGGQVDSFNISPTGILRIEGVGTTHFGLYAPTNADLVSNAVRVAGEVFVDGDLSIYSGNNRFNYKNKSVSSNDTAGVEIAVDSTALGGMKANNIRIHATQNGFGINTSGALIADLGNIEITANGNIAFKSAAATKDIKIKSVSGDIHATSGGNVYAQGMDFAAGRDFTNDATLEVDKEICIAAGRDFKNNKRILSVGNLEIYTDRDFTNTTDGDIQSNADLDMDIGRNATNSGGIYSKNNMSMIAGGNTQNNLGAFIVSNKDLQIKATGDITNIGKINVARDGWLDALNLKNYGQILANRDLDFNIGNDLINYRAAAILAGGSILFHIARNLINYKAEIYALGDIEFEGRENISPAASNPALNATLYDNPYIAAEPSTPVVNPPSLIQLPEEIENILSTQFELADGTILALPEDAFADEPLAGDTWTDENGYIFIVGQEVVDTRDNPCIAAENCEADAPATITTYSYTGTDTITIKSNIADAEGRRTTLAYTILEPQDAIEDSVEDTTPPPTQSAGEIPVQNGTIQYTNGALGTGNSIIAGYEFNDNKLGTLLNWAGRIEAGGNIEINATEIKNKGFDVNTGNARATTAYTRHSRDCEWIAMSCGWAVVGRNYITETHLDSIAAQIIAGGGLLINGNNLLNQSGVISSRGDMILNLRDSVKNQTFSEIQNLDLLEHRSVWKWRRSGWGIPYYWAANEYRTRTEQKRIYSKQRSTILSGGDLKIKTSSLENDQELNPLSGLTFNSPIPAEIRNTISVDIRLPEGDNGLFHTTPDGKYLVETNVSFINPNDFIGSDYFFSNLGNGTTQVDTRRIIGDPAYETRLIMDAITKATQQHYLDNEAQFGSDTEQMKTLYDAAIDAGKEMNLKVGVALTNSQIAQLQEDIIWYVEKNINGEKVLVPQLYLSQATLDSLDTNKGSKITGFSVGVESDYVANFGTIDAEALLAIDAKEVRNESNDSNLAKLHSDGGLSIKAEKVENLSAEISADITKIEADELTNRTKVLSEDYSYHNGGYNEDRHVEQAAQTATISGNSGLKIDVEGILHNSGAKLESENGNVIVSANDVIFDTIQLRNSSRVSDSKDFIVVSTNTTDTKESIKNVGSEINAGGGISITTKEDATFAGSTINADGDIFMEVGGNTNIVAVKDYEYSKHDESMSVLGGLYSKKDVVEDSAEHLKGAQVNTQEGLTIVGGKNINMVASDLNVGEDANLFAGYKINEDGGLEKSGKGGSVNVLSTEEVSTHYEKHETTNMIEGALHIVAAVATGGLSLVATAAMADYDCEGGHCSASIKMGEHITDENSSATSTSVASNLNIGGNLNIGAADDINVRGSNISAIGDAYFDAGHDINITSSESKHKESSSHEEETLKLSATVGNSYVDTGYVLYAVYEAEQAVEEATKKLNDLKNGLGLDGDAKRKEIKEAEERLQNLEDSYASGDASKREVDAAKKELEKLKAGSEATDKAIANAETNLAFAYSNLAMATLAAAQSIAKSAGSTPLYGFYGSGGLSLDTNLEEKSSSQTMSVASNIVSEGNIVFSAGNNMSQIGSNVASLGGSILYDIMNNLDISAAKNTMESSESSSKSNANFAIGTNGTSGGVRHNESESSGTSTFYANSTTSAENGAIIYEVGGDMTASGYNALAKEIDLNVKGDFTLESKQNTSSSSNSSWGMNAGLGTGTASIGGSVGNGSSDRTWTDSASSMVGTESVNAEVGGNLHLGGAMIANIGEDGKDNGNLIVRAGSITYSDLDDTESSNQTGFNAGVSGSNPLGKNDGKPQGSTTFGMTDSGSEKEGITHATIGNGSIIIGGEENPELAGLNRDTNNFQEITKDQITGALGFSATIDNRIISGLADLALSGLDYAAGGNFNLDKNNGLLDIYNDFRHLGGNTFNAAVNATVSAAGVGKFLTYDLSLNLYENGTDFGKVLKTAVDEFKHGAIENQIGQNPKIRDVLNNQENMTPEQFAAIKGELIKIFNDNGVDLKDITLYTNAEGRQGFYTKDADGNRETVALGIINQLTNQQLTGKELTGLMHYETTDHTSGKMTIDGYANQIGLYGQESRDFFNALRFTDYVDNSGLDRDGYNAAHGNHALIQYGNYMSQTISPKDTTNLTWGKLSADGTTMRISGAVKDGNRDIIDEETGKPIGKSIFDDSFVMYDARTGEYMGPAIGNTIYLKEDKTGDINNRVEQANGELPWTVKQESKLGGKYDVKNVYAIEKGAPSGDSLEEKRERAKFHYDGYGYNGEYDSGRGLGNTLAGRNMQNIPLPNSWMISEAGSYQAESNKTSTTTETQDALRNINYGIQEQRIINRNNRAQQINSLFPSNPLLQLNK